MTGHRAQVLVRALAQDPDPERFRLAGADPPCPGTRITRAASGLFRAVQTLKSWGIEPWFVTSNTMIPRFTMSVDNLNLNSLGFPAVTVTFVTAVAPERAIVRAARVPQTSKDTAASTGTRVINSPYRRYRGHSLDRRTQAYALGEPPYGSAVRLVPAAAVPGRSRWCVLAARRARAR